MNAMRTPICQSCGMTLARPEDRGTDAAGQLIEKYCRFCYVRGAFTNPSATADAMIRLGAHILVERGMLEPDAHALMTRTVPLLERWRVS